MARFRKWLFKKVFFGDDFGGAMLESSHFACFCAGPGEPQVDYPEVASFGREELEGAESQGPAWMRKW